MFLCSFRRNNCPVFGVQHNLTSSFTLDLCNYMHTTRQTYESVVLETSGLGSWPPNAEIASAFNLSLLENPLSLVVTDKYMHLYNELQPLILGFLVFGELDNVHCVLIVRYTFHPRHYGSENKTLRRSWLLFSRSTLNVFKINAALIYKETLNELYHLLPEDVILLNVHGLFGL